MPLPVVSFVLYYVGNDDLNIVAVHCFLPTSFLLWTNGTKLSPRVNHIRASMKHLRRCCWQLTQPLSSLSKQAFHCHARMSSIFVLHGCSEAAQVNVQSFTLAETVRWDRRLLGIDGIRDYRESRFLIWTVMSFTLAPAALRVFLSHSKLPANRIIRGKRIKNSHAEEGDYLRKFTLVPGDSWS